MHVKYTYSWNKSTKILIIDSFMYDNDYKYKNLCQNLSKAIIG